ncbi:MAG: hypothetical protein ACRDRM_04165 [Pseudonocardiaceae bacterium]
MAELPGSDPQLRRARIATLAALGTTLLTSLIMPGIGLLFERARCGWSSGRSASSPS